MWIYYMEQVRKFQIDGINNLWDIAKRKTGSPAVKNQLILLYEYKKLLCNVSLREWSLSMITWKS